MNKTGLKCLLLFLFCCYSGYGLCNNVILFCPSPLPGSVIKVSGGHEVIVRIPSVTSGYVSWHKNATGSQAPGGAVSYSHEVIGSYMLGRMKVNLGYGTYTVYVEYRGPTCTSARVPITFNIKPPPPPPPPVPAFVTSNVYSNPSDPVPTCKGDLELTATILIQGAQVTGWSVNNGAVIPGSAGLTFIPQVSGAYRAHTNRAGSSGSTTSGPFLVELIPNFALAGNLAVNKPSICKGDELEFTVTVPHQLQGGINYEWFVNNGPVGTNSSTFKTTDYVAGNEVKCIISGKNGHCIENGILQLIADPVNVVDHGVSISPGNDIVICDSDQVDLSASAQVGVHFLWYTLDDKLLKIGDTYSTASTDPLKLVTVGYEYGCRTETPVTITKSIENHRPEIPLLEANGLHSYSLLRNNDNNDYEYYWQTDEMGKDESNSVPVRTISEGSSSHQPDIYYLRPKKKLTQCWGKSTSLEVFKTSETIYPGSGLDQSSVNSVHTYDYVSKQNESSDPELLSANEVVSSTQYLDGLGRLVQSVQKQFSPLLKDIVQPVDYEENGRVVRNFLPYISGSNDGSLDPQPIQGVFRQYSNDPDCPYCPDTDYPFEFNRFEGSRSNTVIRQAAPGNDWSGTAMTLEAKSIDYINGLNSGLDRVMIWQVDGELPEAVGLYDAGQLTKSVTIDEEDHAVISFINKRGQTILKRVQAHENGTSEQWADTYYVYDDFDDLRYVLPPEAVNGLNTTDLDAYYQGSGILLTQDHTFGTADNGDTQTYFYVKWVTVTLGPNFVAGQGFAVKPLIVKPSPSLLNRYAFRYKYDSRKRMVEKQVPGAEPVYMVYDNRDRLVLTQDGEQRKKNEWLFTKYNALNRPILTGIHDTTVALSQSEMQVVVNEHYQRVSASFYETLSGVVHGYTNNSYPVQSEEDSYLTVTYYDNYSFPHAANYSFAPALGHTLPFDQVKGQITGTKAKTLDGTNTWLEGVTYYDGRYRVIQTQTENLFNTVDIVTHRYDFVGKVLETETRHGNQTILRSFDYDHASRLINTWHELTDNGVSHGRKLLAHNGYNELGELIEKNLHSEDDGSMFHQSLDYRYNIRGWLTSINNAQLSDAANNNDTGQAQDYWGMELGYNNALSGITATPAFNGNISAVKWSDNLGLGNATNIKERAYAYTYDPMNRIKSAQHSQYTSAWAANDHFKLEGLTYDLNGNIEALTRKDDLGANMDVLTYTYTGNQLLGVTDSGDDTAGFKDGTNGGNDYLYDDNGNMTKDLNKGITSIAYNHLNLPTRVEKDANNYILYTYDATGIKLRQEVYEGGAPTKTTDYAGEFIYENDTLQFIQHEEGRIVPALDTGPRNWDYEYRIDDHLGNTRVMFTTNPKTITFTANYEGDPNNPDDQPLFEDVQIGSEGDFNHTTGDPNYTNAQVLRSSPNSQIGSAIAIPVGQGDKITAVAFAKYIAAAQDPNVTSVTIASALVSAFTGITSSGIEGGTGTINNNFGSGSLIGGTGFPLESGTAPKAFLNLMFLPEDDPISLVKDASFAYDQVADGATEAVIDGVSTSPFDELRIDDFVVPDQGYVMVYVSNEGSLTDVYFDDIEITVNEHPVIEKTDYYPFGLTHGNGFQRVTAKENKYKFNGKERIPDLDLNWDDFGARMYMPDIGRWGVIDPLADQGGQERWSPYVFAFDNPIRFIDPDGMMATDSTGTADQITQAAQNAVDHVVETYDTDGSQSAQCNRGVCGAFEELTGSDELQGLTANEIIDHAENSANFGEVDLEDVQELANSGEIVIAGKKEGSSGHVVLVVPGEEVTSGSWGGKVPQVMDTGAGKRTAQKGINYSWSSKDGVKFYKYTDNRIYNGGTLDNVTVTGTRIPMRIEPSLNIKLPKTTVSLR